MTERSLQDIVKRFD